MDSIPYELLQHIATWLLPRYQCRLALASKWCYQHLYTDLLQWHARRALLGVPNHKILCARDENKIISILVTPENPNVIIMEDCSGSLSVKNITKLYFSVVYSAKYMDNMCHARRMDSIEIHYCFKTFRTLDFLAGCYQHVDKDVLVTYINIRQPIYSLNRKMLKNLHTYLYNADTNNLIRAMVS